MIQENSLFNKYVLTEEERAQAYALSPLTRAELQTLMAGAAEEMIQEIFKSKLTAVEERENIRYLQGQIDILKQILAMAESYQDELQQIQRNRAEQEQQ